MTVWRTVPLVASSTFPKSSALSDTLRRTSFSSSTWVSAWSRASLSVRELDRLLAELDRGPGVLEVEAGADLALRLVDRVADLLHVELGDDVERGHVGSLCGSVRLPVEHSGSSRANGRRKSA